MIANVPYIVFVRMKKLHTIPHANITITARNRAMETLCAVGGVDMINPSPDEEGGISLEWFRDDLRLLIEVDNDGGAHCIHSPRKHKYNVSSIKPHEDSWQIIIKAKAVLKDD